MLKDNNKVTVALIRARQSIADSAANLGGCDHSTGLCTCAEARIVCEIDSLLFEAFGLDMVWQFFYAEPTNTTAARRKWKGDAQRAINYLAFLKAGEVDAHIGNEEDFPS